ncbi:MAG: hypothetical protein NT001_06475 [Candidatus Woesearchaeota archaeon]|nr:hypothetical protein [Candidatus Woesearchaeota archaeon]
MAPYRYRQVKVQSANRLPDAKKSSKALRTAKTCKPIDYETLALVLGIAIILLIVFFISYAAFNGWFSRIGKPDTEIVFLRPPLCSERCIEAKAAISSVAEQANIGFREAKYGQSSLPGYVLFYNDSALISGYVDEDAFKEQICGFTKLDEVCALAKSRQQQ